MIVSHKHKFIFMKTIKTASSSVEIALSRVLGPDDILTPAREGVDKLRYGGPGGRNYRLEHPDVPRIPLWRKLLGRPERYYHETLGYYEHMPAWRVKHYLGDDIWSSYYKFSFERNPWDRQVSFYHYKTREKSAARRPSFDKFMAKGDKALVDNWSIYAIGDDIALDFVGRYENIDEDFEKAMKAVGLGNQITLPHVNVGTTKPAGCGYREYYTDKTRALVSENSAREIKHFGYKF